MEKSCQCTLRCLINRYTRLMPPKNGRKNASLFLDKIWKLRPQCEAMERRILLWCGVGPLYHQPPAFELVFTVFTTSQFTTSFNEGTVDPRQSPSALKQIYLKKTVFMTCSSNILFTISHRPFRWSSLHSSIGFFVELFWGQPGVLGDSVQLQMKLIPFSTIMS